MQPQPRHKGILVLGIGNYLMGDEGIGIHAAKYLQQQAFPEKVHILDGGTGGFNLLPYLEEYDPVIIIDATADGSPPGTLRIRKPRYSSEFPRTLGAHDIGLKDLIESATILDTLPEIYLITLAIDPGNELTTGISPVLKEKLPLIEKEIRAIISVHTG